jgi:uncharacterized protein YbgA (DUF1722 family)/uncharacterized protein YbbK (DUF523 family)
LTRSRPIIFVSKCLGFEACRWDGAIINDGFVERLGKHVNFLTNCPEKELGLGCPRPPIRIVLLNGKKALYQPETKRDISREMASYREKITSSLKREDLSGFILKSRSPSCGIKDVKLFSNEKEKAARTAEGTEGFFGEAVQREFKDLAIEDEGRLTNFTIRENFLAKIFIHAEFLAVKRAGKAKDLTEFQAKNKFILMAYNEKEMRIMGKLAADAGKNAAAVLEEYEKHLLKALSKPAGIKAVTNVLLHVLGFFKEKLVKEEKGFFLNGLEKYKKGKLPLSTVTGLLQLWIMKYRVDYLKDQTFFSPYPDELADISDSGKGR